MRVLVACEYSGRVRRAFAKRGHDAWSCDLLPSEDFSDKHIQDDVREILGTKWDLLIGHPPCTRLANSGVRWLHERNLWEDLERDAMLFRELLMADHIPRIAIENPVQHKHAKALIEQDYAQTIQPWQFWHLGEPGTGESKRTCLWLKDLPALIPTTPNETGRKQACWLMSPGPERWKERSRTYEGIADAMAAQWGRA